MNTDCAFWIGRTHEVCQDYALAATQKGFSYVILADGCSSSDDTDIGARLLAKSAEHLLPALTPFPVNSVSSSRGLEEWIAYEEWINYHETAIRAAAECACCLDLAPCCLDATLMTIKAENGIFLASCWGDGVVALGRRDGTVDVFAISFAASYPQYPSYLLDNTRSQQWATQPGNKKRVQRWTLTQAASIKPKEEESDAEESHAAMELYGGTAAEYRFVAVFSDGVQSFARTERTETSRTTLPMGLAEVLAELLAFKSGQGKFVQRRVQSFRKECQKREWHHADDVAVGVLWLDD